MVLLCTGTGLVFLFVLFLIFGSGCYLLSQGAGLMGAYSGGISVEKALSRTDLSDDERRMLEESLLIRKFAHEQLGLTLTKNYSVFVRAKKDYLADVVNACEPYSFNTYFWDYPMMGKLPYKGFFKREDAEAEATRLKKKGFDVLIRNVDAFSTLGFFTDPLFSFMSTYSMADLADLIIHESTHATIFVKGQAEFNENLASFVGEKGSLLYIENRYGKDSVEYQNAVAGLIDMDTYRALLNGLIVSLQQLYTDPDLVTIEEQKHIIISDFLADFDAQYSSRFKTRNFKGLSSIKIDNAYLSLFLNYNSQMSQWNAVYQKSGKTLFDFLVLVKSMPKKNADPWEWLEAHTTVEKVDNEPVSDITPPDQL